MKETGLEVAQWIYLYKIFLNLRIFTSFPTIHVPLLRHVVFPFIYLLKNQSTTMRHLDIFLIFLFVRILSIFLVQTYFVADEYWQSLEVAHKIVFDYGYLSWEWVAGIRSYIYPLLIAALYKTLALLRLDYPLAIVSAVLFLKTQNNY